MPTYALLLAPSANRVYASAAPALTRAEIGVLNEAALDGELGDLAETTIAGVTYVRFEAAELSQAALGQLGRLSAGYALFELHGELLRPVPLPSPDQFDDDLVTIQKYAGKTNEQFTKLLVNVTLWSAELGPAELGSTEQGHTERGSTHERRLRVFDPLCGRGTTLNQALMYGYDAVGMDIDGKDFDAYIAFLRSYLRRKRLKHQLDVNPVRRAKKVIGRRAEGSIGVSKEQYKAKDALRLTVVNGDSISARDFFKPDSFDVLVTDLPYGVQHGSRPRPAALERSPTDLLAAALPTWVELVRPGGAFGLSWNTYGGDRGELERLCAKAGLEVCSGPAYAGFAHRVDQAINRDVLVARKPRS